MTVGNQAVLSVGISAVDSSTRLPSYARRGDAGMDLAATEEVVLPPGGRESVGTGFCLEIPDGFAGLVVPRSGLALERGVTVLNAPGIIDSGYRGEVRVILINLGQETVRLSRGARIAQLLIMAVPRIQLDEVKSLAPSSRGGEGFGSTGL